MYRQLNVGVDSKNRRSQSSSFRMRTVTACWQRGAVKYSPGSSYPPLATIGLARGQSEKRPRPGQRICLDCERCRSFPLPLPGQISRPRQVHGLRLVRRGGRPLLHPWLHSYPPLRGELMIRKRSSSGRQIVRTAIRQNRSCQARHSSGPMSLFLSFSRLHCGCS